MEKTDKIKTQRNSGPIIFTILLVLLFMGLATGYAEVAQIKSPLSWYEGGSGDYALPKLLNAEYSLSGFVATQGQIKTICVNYNAAGKVTVEVSADNGLHYYRIINGVPLTDNFVSGDRIKWRAKALDEDAKLNALNIMYTDSAGTTTSFGQPELSGFNYRKEILLKNPSGEELFNYQINLKVGMDKKAKEVDLNCEGSVRPDFLDVRFTAADGQTPLAYYFENQIAAQGEASTGYFWVKVPQIPKEGVKIYIYYGNSQASDLSDPKNTFDFYDNFKNTEFDASSWVVKINPKGSSIIKDGQLKLDAAEIIAKDFKFKQGVIEYAVSVESGFENSLNLRTKTQESYDNPELVVYSSAYKGAEQCIAIDDIVKANDAKTSPIAAGGKYNYRLTVMGKDITFERLDQVSGNMQAKVTYSGTAPVKAGYLGLRSGGDGSGRNVIAYSGIRVRKFADNGPQVDKAGALEQVSLSIFSNIALSQKGSLMLKDNTKEGAYIGKAIPAAFNARVIIPAFKGVNAKIAVSADNGANYKEGCASGSYYYVSKKDFIAGAILKPRFDFSRQNLKEASPSLYEFSLEYCPGKITVISPNGKEAWAGETENKIIWIAADYELSYPMKIEFSSDGGKTYALIAEKVANSGEYFWKAPSITSGRALIRVSDGLSPNDAFDVSDKVFSISSSGALTSEGQIEVKTPVKPAQKPKPDKTNEEGIYELLIKIGDNPSPSGYKEGDIVVIRPAGYLWGADERAKFLIVKARLTAQEVKNLVQPQEEITGRDKSGRNITKLLKRRKYRFNMQNKITAQERAMVLKGQLSVKPLEIAGDEPAAFEEKLAQ